jgi:hypothetical protein
MEKRRSVDHSRISKHAYDVLEVIGNIAAVAVFVSITYLIKYG